MAHTFLSHLSKKKRLAILICALMLIIVSFASIISVFMVNFEKTMFEENKRYLSDTSNYIGANIKTVVDDTKKVLTTSTFAISVCENTEEIRYILDSIVDSLGLEYASYALTDKEKSNSVISTMPFEEQKDISKEKYFMEAEAGKTVTEYVNVKLLFDSAISGLQIAVPVYAREIEKPIGVLVGMMNIKKLASLMEVTSYGGRGITYVIAPNGDIIMSTNIFSYSNYFKAFGNVEFTNGYTLDKTIAEIQNKESGYFRCVVFGMEKYAHYTYIGIDEWTIINIVDKNIITENTTKLISQLTFAGIIVIIIFPLLLIVAAMSIKASNSNKQAADAKSAFLANMSHEIRTPMNAIVGISEILLREQLTGTQKNYLFSIINAGNGLLTIINDILDISKIDSGKFSIIDEEYELESLVYDIIAIIGIRIGDKPIEFLLDMDTDLPKYLKGDMIRIKQILINILGNAVKFTKTGFIKFGIHASVVGGKYVLTMPIEDTGMGIQKKDLAILFERFNQVDTHKNRNIEGTGLGLVISKRLSEMMGGDISVKSEYEKGSTFTVTVTQGITREDKILEKGNFEQYKLLLHEPSEILLNYYNSCLEKLKINYDSTNNYDDFVVKMNKGKYTHILTNSENMKKLVADGYDNQNARFVTLLSLKEQSKIENYNIVIFSPLFTMQLLSILKNNKTKMNLSKRTGIDIVSIIPMPFIKILVVDDNEVNLQVANGLMTPYHMQVDCAQSGAKAIEMIKENEYDLVFMDHMMPEMDGVEAVKLIRELPEKSKNSVIIVALTANVTTDAKLTFCQNGFNDFLSKPIETIKLNIILKKWLGELNQKRSEENPTLAKSFEEKLNSQIELPVDVEVSSKVDFKAGIARLGSLDVYCSILVTYQRLLEQQLITLPPLVDTDMKLFVIEVHGIKGASLGICIDNIALLSSKLENLGKENKIKDIKSEMPDYLDEVRDTLAIIGKFLASYYKSKISQNVEQIGTTDKSVSTIITKETLELLKNKFLDFDTEVLRTLLDAACSINYDEETNILIFKIKQCYVDYDFDLPVKLIEEYESKRFH